MAFHRDEEVCTATYIIHRPTKSPQSIAEGIAVGCTIGAYADGSPAERQRLAPYVGEVSSTEILSEDEQGIVDLQVRVAFPIVNLNGTLPSLLVCTFGKLSMDGEIKLKDLDIGSRFLQNFQGPRFGLDGLRKLLNVYGRPFVSSIMKSSNGRGLAELAEQFEAQALGGADLIKDDEIFFDQSSAPVLPRISKFRSIADRILQETGHQVLYAVNLTGRNSQLLQNARHAVEAGASCLLLSTLAYGFDTLQELSEADDIGVPILSHPAMMGGLYSPPHHGISPSLLLGKLVRLAGADIALYPSPYGSVTMRQQDAIELADVVRADWGALKKAVPAPSAGIHPGLVPNLVQDFGMDQMIKAGGGIHSHPNGPTAGAKAMRDAVDAAIHGVPLAEAAEKSQPLAAALKFWGKPNA